jgi:hypothetical protein
VVWFPISIAVAATCLHCNPVFLSDAFIGVDDSLDNEAKLLLLSYITDNESVVARQLLETAT